jgi:hypothetical protein
VTEDELLENVIDTAHLFGWRVAHFRPAMTSKGWRTAVSADGKGFVDCVIARQGEVLFRELKGTGGQLTDEQEEWIFELMGGCNSVDVWYPSHWEDGTIEAELRR